MSTDVEGSERAKYMDKIEVSNGLDFLVSELKGINPSNQVFVKDSNLESALDKIDNWNAESAHVLLEKVLKTYEILGDEKVVKKLGGIIPKVQKVIGDCHIDRADYFLLQDPQIREYADSAATDIRFGLESWERSGIVPQEQIGLYRKTLREIEKIAETM